MAIDHHVDRMTIEVLHLGQWRTGNLPALLSWASGGRATGPFEVAAVSDALLGAPVFTPVVVESRRRQDGHPVATWTVRRTE